MAKTHRCCLIFTRPAKLLVRWERDGPSSVVRPRYTWTLRWSLVICRMRAFVLKVVRLFGTPGQKSSGSTDKPAKTWNICRMGDAPTSMCKNYMLNHLVHASSAHSYGYVAAKASQTDETLLLDSRINSISYLSAWKTLIKTRLPRRFALEDNEHIMDSLEKKNKGQFLRNKNTVQSSAVHMS